VQHIDRGEPDPLGARGIVERALENRELRDDLDRAAGDRHPAEPVGRAQPAGWGQPCHRRSTTEKTSGQDDCAQHASHQSKDRSSAKLAIHLARTD
jgi:hypothetical protein